MRQLTFTPPLHFLTPLLKERLNKILCVQDEHLMPHALAVRLGIDYAQSLSILATLKAKGVCQNRLLIYHNCEPGVPAGSIPYGVGFPQLPWDCPLCEESVTSYDDLRFDLESIIIDPAEII